MYNSTGSGKTSLKFIIFSISIVLIIPALLIPLLKKTGLYSDNILLVFDAICVILIFFYIRIADNKNPADYLRLSRNFLKGMGWGSFFSLVIVTAAIFQNIHWGKGDMKVPAASNWIITPLIIGLVREIPFRGFIQRHLEKGVNIVSAIVLTSFLFVFHYYIRLSYSVPFQQIALLFVMSLVLGIITHRTKSLWSAILINSFINLSTILFLT